MEQSDKNAFTKQSSDSADDFGASSARQAGSPAPPSSTQTTFDQINISSDMVIDSDAKISPSEDETSFETGELETGPISGSANNRSQSSKATKRDRSVEKENNFEKFEKALFARVKADLKCSKCDGTQLTNSGVGGSVNQFNVRLIQVKCKACAKKMRLKELLEYSRMTLEIEEYDLKKKSDFDSKTPKKEQKNTKKEQKNTPLTKFSEPEKAKEAVSSEPKNEAPQSKSEVDDPIELEKSKEVYALKQENEILKSYKAFFFL